MVYQWKFHHGRHRPTASLRSFLQTIQQIHQSVCTAKDSRIPIATMFQHLRMFTRNSHCREGKCSNGIHLSFKRICTKHNSRGNSQCLPATYRRSMAPHPRRHLLDLRPLRLGMTTHVPPWIRDDHHMIQADPHWNLVGHHMTEAHPQQHHCPLRLNDPFQPRRHLQLLSRPNL